MVNSNRKKYGGIALGVFGLKRPFMGLTLELPTLKGGGGKILKKSGGGGAKSMQYIKILYGY